MAKPTGKKNTISVDFSQTESSGPREIPEGEYLIQIQDYEEKESQAGNPMIAFTHKVSEGPYKGAKLWDNISLTPQALWRFRAMLESLGIDASKKLDLDLGSLKGKTLRVTISHEVYNGKTKPRITDFLAQVSAPKAPAGTAIKKGSQVTFEHEGDSYSGKVVSLDGSNASVAITVDGETEEWELSLDELKLAA